MSAEQVPGIPFQPGADPRRGSGKPGRSGRPPNSYREWLRWQLGQKDIRAAVLDVLRDSKHKHFAKVWAKAVDQAFGSPKQEIDFGERGLPVIRVVGGAKPKEEQVATDDDAG